MKKSVLISLLLMTAACSAQELAVTIVVENENCVQGNNNGSITVNVSGGIPEYKVELTNLDTDEVNIKPGKDGQTTFEFLRLSAAAYRILVTDSKEPNPDSVDRGVELIFTELDCTVTSTPENFKTGDLGSITVTITEDSNSPPFKVTVAGKTFEDVEVDEPVTFGGLEAGTYTVTIEDEPGCQRDKCIPVLSDNGILNFIIQKYCSACTTG